LISYLLAAKPDFQFFQRKWEACFRQPRDALTRDYQLLEGRKEVQPRRKIYETRTIIKFELLQGGEVVAE
jgi:hypothetical protein